jgi:hypothetical protein
MDEVGADAPARDTSGLRRPGGASRGHRGALGFPLKKVRERPVGAPGDGQRRTEGWL